MNSHRTIWITLLLCVVLFARCQDEKMEESFPEPDKIISPGSTTATLVERTVLNDGSYDNILDQASCISLKLPVTIAIKSQTFQLNIKEDIYALANHPDKDKIRLIFPVTAVFADYSEVTVKDKGKLKNLIKSCSDDNDIECTDFAFPLLVYAYNVDRHLQATHTVENDRALYKLIKGMKKDDIMSFKFPLHMKPKDGGDVEIGNNLQLNDHIISVDEVCDEGDDIDDPAGVDFHKFQETLTREKWKITYFYDSDRNDDKTSDFSGYEFDFKPNKTIQAKKTSNVSGRWEIEEEDHGHGRDQHDHRAYALEMTWDNVGSFKKLEEDWDIISFSNNKITLSHDESKLIFEKK